MLGPAREPRGGALAREQGQEPAAAARTENHLGGILGTGEPQQRLGHVVTGQLLEAAAEQRHKRPLGIQRRGIAGRQAVVTVHVHGQQVAAGGAGGDPGGTPDDGLIVLLAGDADDNSLPCLPWRGDAVLGTVPLQALLHPVGQPEQGQFTQCGEVSWPEVMSERGLDPVRRVDIAMHHPPPQRLRGHIDQLDLVGAARYRVGQGLVLLHAGDLFRHVAERLEVLDVQGGNDVDARVEQFIDVLPSLGVPAAGHVGVGELVHQRDLRAASEHRVQVHLGEGRTAVAHRAPRHQLQSLGHCRSQPAAVILKERDDHVRVA